MQQKGGNTGAAYNQLIAKEKFNTEVVACIGIFDTFQTPASKNLNAGQTEVNDNLVDAWTVLQPGIQVYFTEGQIAYLLYPVSTGQTQVYT